MELSKIDIPTASTSDLVSARLEATGKYQDLYNSLDSAKDYLEMSSMTKRLAFYRKTMDKIDKEMSMRFPKDNNGQSALF